MEAKGGSGGTVEQRGRVATLALAERSSGAAEGEFDILAISAGVGNGWVFTPEALRASTALWDGVECFIDHAGAGGKSPGMSVSAHSVRDLAGVLHSPEFDEALGGIKARLRALGPSAGLLNELGRQMLAEGRKPKVGFSADVLFRAEGRQVVEILRVLSVDLVFNPARGGMFLRSVNQKGEAWMSDEIESERHEGSEGPRDDGVNKEEGQRAAMCRYLLDAALLSSRLPQPAMARIRAQFGGKVFDAAELDRAISDARTFVAELTGRGAVAGTGRVSVGLSGEERLQMAVDDLFGLPREAGKESVKVERLSGIRELYLTLTGDADMHGGYYPERARLATTADFTGLVKNALNKLVAERWSELGRAGYDWWKKIVSVEHCTSLNDITGILVGTVGDLPTVAEGAAYTELPVGDSPETGTFTKYGGYIPLTLELIDRDETRKLKEYPRALATAGMRKISALVSEIFTQSGGTGPLMADGGRLFNATAVTTAGGHKNLLTAALSATEWDVASTAVYDQPLLTKNSAPYTGVGPKMAINPRYLLVPRNLQLAAMKILYPTLENAANIYSENQQRGQPGDVITVPEWTDATDWAAVCDPAVAPAIYVGERFGLMPEVFIAGSELSPAVFMNDEHRLKVRHFLSVFVTDYRPLHKSNVAG